MVNCSYCGNEVKRLVFCSPSHKVMYHRKPHGDIKFIHNIQKAKHIDTCKHGSMLGLCKYGCK